MNELNLMPVWAVQKQQRRRVGIRLAAVEAVIFSLLSLMAGVLLYNTASAQRRVDLLESAMRGDYYDEADLAAEALQASEANAEARRNALDILTPGLFEYAWLAAVSEAVPSGAQLTEIDMRGTDITVIAIADDFGLAEQHRLALAGQELFAWIRLGPAVRDGDGHIRYTLRLGVR